jgi:hypothetical protein
MFTASQLVAHLVGDYFLQSDWMALNKQRNDLTGWAAVTIHAITYTLPFLLLTQSVAALAIIAGSHLVIDHFKLAPYISYVKNFLAPPSWWFKWKDCKATGYNPERPAFISVWLSIIVDNTMHLLINGLALTS